jgi:hypothetical protein
MFAYSVGYCLVLAGALYGLNYWVNRFAVGVATGLAAAILVTYAYYRTMVHTCRECSFDPEGFKWRTFTAAGRSELAPLEILRQAGRFSVTFRHRELLGFGSTCLVVIRLESGFELHLLGARWGRQRMSLALFADALSGAIKAANGVSPDQQSPEGQFGKNR